MSQSAPFPFCRTWMGPVLGSERYFPKPLVVWSVVSRSLFSRLFFLDCRRTVSGTATTMALLVTPILWSQGAHDVPSRLPYSSSSNNELPEPSVFAALSRGISPRHLPETG